MPCETKLEKGQAEACWKARIRLNCKMFVDKEPTNILSVTLPFHHYIYDKVRIVIGGPTNHLTYTPWNRYSC